MKAKPAERFQRSTVRTGPAAGLTPDNFARSLAAEVRGSLARILSHHKAETIATECDRKRSTIYVWAAKPGQIPLEALPVLADFDPDPEFVTRLAGHLLAHAAARSLARQAAGGAVLIVSQLSAPVAADRESVRRATGQFPEGSD